MNTLTTNDYLKAKIELREIIIEECGEKYYYDMMTQRIAFIHDVLKKTQDAFNMDSDEFREYLRFIIANETYESEEEMLEEFMLMDIALDTLT